VNNIKTVTTKNAYELANALGLQNSDATVLEFRSNLNEKIISLVKKKKTTHAEIAKKMGTSRTRVTAFLNGSRTDFSTDFLLRMLGALEHKIVFKTSKIPVAI